MAQCSAPGDYTGNVPDLGNMSWVSQPYFTYSTFRSFHKAANESLSWIFPDHEDYQGYRLNPDDLLDFSEDSIDVDEIIWKNRGPLAFGLIGVILGAVVTIFGIGWCCVKCCSCICRKKTSSPDRYNTNYYDDDEMLDKFGYEKKKQKRCRIACGVVLLIWLLLSVASLSSLFVFNDQLRDGIDGMTEDLELSLDDAELYLRTTQRQVNGVLATSYMQLNTSLNCLLDEMGIPRTMNSSIVQFQEIETISQKMNGQDMERSLNLTIETLSEFCKVNVCENEAAIAQNLSQLASTLAGIRAVTTSMESFAKESMEKLYFTEKQAIIINGIREDLFEQGEALHNHAETLTATLGDVIDAVIDAREELREVEEEFDKVNPPLYASVLVIVLFLVFVTILFGAGAILSFFGRSNTMAGKARSCTLSCGLVSIFIFGGTLWIFTMGAFFLSGLVTQVVPANLRHLENNITLEDKPLSAHHGVKVDDYKVPSYGFIARNCREGNSAYVTFNLSQVYDVESIKELVDILRPRASLLKNSDISRSINPVLSEASSFTTELQNSQDRLSSFTVELDNILTTLTKLASDNADFGNNSPSILTSVNALSKMHGTELQDLKRGVEALSKILPAAVAELSQINKDTQESPEEKFIAYVADYSDFAYNQIYYNVGECEPMYNALNSTVNLFTYKIGSRIASFWWSLNIVMLLFLPSIITATVLERL